jgi:KUP system potassium uptake protein
LLVVANPEASSTSSSSGAVVGRAAGLGIFFDKLGNGGGVPRVFAQFVGKFRVRPGVVVFFHVRSLSRPTVPAAERYVVARAPAGGGGCYRVTVRCGYMDDVLTPELGREVVQQLVLYITRGKGAKGEVGEYTPEVRGELEALEKAAEEQMVYVIGKEVMKVKKDQGVKGFLRFMVLETFLWIRENSRTKLADLDIDADNLVEVGFVKEI